MSLSLAEQETVITFDRSENTANIYTADSNLLARLDKNKNYKRVKVYKQNGNIIAADFQVDKKLILIRSKRVTRNLTDKQKRENAERLKRAREHSEGA